MDSFEWNKIIGAFLGAVFIMFSVSLISEAVFSTPAPETPGYAIAVPESGDEDAPVEEEVESVLPLLASADPSAGEGVFRRCQACHTTEEGGANRVGPNLWDVVDRAIASHEGFGYSAALEEFSEGGEVTWTYEHLDHFLHDPRGYVPGTAMAFAGLNNVEDRANVIAYLRSLSDEPAPLPEAAPAEGEDGAEAAPADEAEEAAPAETDEAPAAEDAPAADEPAEPEATEEPAPAEEEGATEAPADDAAADAENGEAEAPADEPATPAE